jgi:hypothetical protein
MTAYHRPVREPLDSTVNRIIPVRKGDWGLLAFDGRRRVVPHCADDGVPEGLVGHGCGRETKPIRLCV